MILRPPRSTRTDTLFPSRRSSDLLAGLGQLVPAELEHFVARHLRIIGREVARLLALEMVHLGLPVRLDRQVAAPAARRPRQMAGEAGHAIVAVGAILLSNPRPPGELTILRSEEHTSELQSLMRISYAVFCL